MDVDDCRTGVRCALSLLPDLFRRVRDCRTLGPCRQHAGEGGGDDDLVRQTGMFPCFRQGRSTVFSLACSMPSMITRRVSAGSITSSIIAQPAARYGVIDFRMVSTSCARLASGLSDASTCLLKIMFTAPSGPITEISAKGQATIVSGSYPFPHIT